MAPIGTSSKNKRPVPYYGAALYFSFPILYPMPCSKLFFAAVLLWLCTGTASAQQLSLGNTPYSVNKSAVLELNSTKQGLLLPRLSDTVSINALNPPDGMVVYYIPSKQFLLRANGYWNPLASASSFNNYWSTAGNSNGVVKKLGNSDNYELPFVTNNIERMRIAADGRVGIGVTAPANNLAVKDTIEIKRSGSVSALLFSNTGSVGDFRIAGDGGDIFWQGGGGRNLQMGAYWGMVLSGDRQSSALPAFTAGTGGIGVLIPAQRSASVPLAVQGASGQTANLTEWRNSSNTVLNAVTSAGNLGIGTASPLTKLHVYGTNPLTLTGVQTGGTTTADSLLTINNGTVQKLPVSTFSTASSLWSTTGNGGINWATHFLGSTNNASLRFRTNNTERLIIDSLGKVAIGTNGFDAAQPERFLVDAGITTSYNLIKAKGSINNYLQMNLQNLSNGTAASTDIVATADNGTETSNYVDLGINGSGYTGGYFGAANDGYLYNLGQDFLIGNGTAGKKLHFLTGGGDKAANTRMMIDDDGNVGIGSTSFDAVSPERLLVDAGTSTYTGILARGNTNTYFQVNVKNTNAGNQSSSDLVATANNGTETTNFVNVGINGSNYVYQTGNPIETGKANDGYLLSSGNDLYIVNNNASKDIIFLAGGTAPVNEAMRITATEKLGIGTIAPSEKLHVVQTTGTGTTQTAIATIETNNATTSASSLPPFLQMVRQVPSFTASTNYIGPGLSFGFRTGTAVSNFAQIVTTSMPATSRLSFYSRTGMTNANPATGTLAENMYLDGTALNVKNLQGGTSNIGVDANGNIIRTISDARLKRNVQSIENPLSKIMKMRGVTYNWIDTAKMGTQKEIGFVAQELEKVVPEVVSSGAEYKSVNYPLLTALLTEGMKEQQKEIDGLKKELQEIREEILLIKKALLKPDANKQ